MNTNQNQDVADDCVETDREALIASGVTDYCNQVCGGGNCGTGPLCQYGIDSKTHMPPAKKSPSELADDAFGAYDFGDGVEVTDTSGWEYSTPGLERSRKVFVETTQEDDGPAPRWVLTFTVRFNAGDGSIAEAYAIDDKGQIWGCLPGRENEKPAFVRDHHILQPSGRFITDKTGRKIAEMFQPGDSVAEQEAYKRRLVGSFNQLPSLIGVLLRADADGRLSQVLYSEGISDAFEDVLKESLEAIGPEGVAEMIQRYEINEASVQPYLAQ